MYLLGYVPTNLKSKPTPLVSHDQSEIILIFWSVAQETFIIIIIINKIIIIMIKISIYLK